MSKQEPSQIEFATLLTNKPNSDQHNFALYLQKCLSESKSADFLVGYFYFSGIDLLIEKIKEVKLRVLIGMNAGLDDYGFLYESRFIKFSSVLEAQESFFSNVKNILNLSRELDTYEITKYWQIYLEKINNGSLEIRQTKEPNHAKMYIFYLKDDLAQTVEFKTRLVTGSSNLSYSGLTGRGEINIRTIEKQSNEEATALFEELWKDATPLLNQENFEKFKEKVVQKVWINRTFSPFQLYIKVLIDYFEIKDIPNIETPEKITNGEMKDLDYQVDAIKQGINIINEHNGVIIADVVGLGKSIIASTIARNLKLPTMIICPPNLIQQWREYKIKFGFNGEIFSRGKLELAKDFSSNIPSQKLIIIDEAHWFRNSQTKQYEILDELCKGNKVILLSATPFNNSPKDLASLLNLFQIPSRPTINTVNDLDQSLRNLQKNYEDALEKGKNLNKTEVSKKISEITKQLKAIIRPVTVRRSRLDLQQIPRYQENLEAMNMQFPRVNNPELKTYQLGYEIAKKYGETLELILDSNNPTNSFVGVRYKPAEYIKNYEKYKQRLEVGFNVKSFDFVKNSQQNLAKFMRTLMIQRFESSIYAFWSTLQKMIYYHQVYLAWYDFGFLPIFKRGNLVDPYEVMENGGFEDIDSELSENQSEQLMKELEDKGYFFIPTSELKQSWQTDIQKDLAILKQIKEIWTGWEKLVDPKLEKMKQDLEQQLNSEPERKIIIFSQYTDTAEYLFKKLNGEGFRVLLHTSQDNNSHQKIQKLRAEFDAGFAEEQQTNDYDILIATDVLSEGFSLHRAGIVINYDMPFNPTRVIQRVGRINRINTAVFDEIYIWNFFPNEFVQNEHRVQQIATFKMAFIHQLLGEDSKVITAEETEDLTTFNSLEEVIEETNKRIAQNEEESEDTKFLKELEELKNSNQEDYLIAKNLPPRVKIKRKQLDKINPGSLLIFARKGNHLITKLFDSQTKTTQAINIHDALGLFKASPDEIAENISETFYEKFAKANLPAEFKTVAANEQGNITRNTAIKLLQLLAQKYQTIPQIDKDYIKQCIEAISVYNAVSLPKIKTIASLLPKTEKHESQQARFLEIYNQVRCIITPEYLQSIYKFVNTDEDRPELVLIVEELGVEEKS